MDPLLIEVPERIETERLILRCPRPGDGPTVNEAEREMILSGRDVAAFMLPDEVRTVSSLPLTAIGKVDKKALRAEIEAR